MDRLSRMSNNLSLQECIVPTLFAAAFLAGSKRCIRCFPGASKKNLFLHACLNSIVVCGIQWKLGTNKSRRYYIAIGLFFNALIIPTLERKMTYRGSMGFTVIEIVTIVGLEILFSGERSPQELLNILVQADSKIGGHSLKHQKMLVPPRLSAAEIARLLFLSDNTKRSMLQNHGDLRAAIIDNKEPLSGFYRRELEKYLQDTRYSYWEHAQSQVVSKESRSLGSGQAMMCLHLLLLEFIATSIEKLSNKQTIMLLHMSHQLKQAFLLKKHKNVKDQEVTAILDSLDNSCHFIAMCGVLFPAGYQGLSDVDGDSGHIVAIGVRRLASDKHVVLDCNAGSANYGRSHYSKSSGSHTISQVICKSQQTVKHFVSKSLLLDRQQQTSSHQTFAYKEDRIGSFIELRQQLLREEGTLEDNIDLPNRPLQELGNCSFQSFMEWVYHICWLNDEVFLGNLLEKYVKEPSFERRGSLIKEQAEIPAQEYHRHQQKYRTIAATSRLTTH